MYLRFSEEFLHGCCFQWLLYIAFYLGISWSASSVSASLNSNAQLRLFSISMTLELHYNSNKTLLIDWKQDESVSPKHKFSVMPTDFKILLKRKACPLKLFYHHFWFQTVPLSIWHHLFLDFWLVDTWIFPHWRHQRTVTRLENVRQ